MPENQIDPEFESPAPESENNLAEEVARQSRDASSQGDAQSLPEDEIPSPGGEPFEPEKDAEPVEDHQAEEVPSSPQVKPETIEVKRHKRRTGSLFFPLLLIVSGVVLLMSNLGLLPNSAWETLISLWPLIFIAWGLDGLWRNEGITGAVFLLGIGIVFLLGNFGYLQQNPWQVLLLLWPVLLVAIGYDIIVGKRRKLWTNLLGLLLVGVIMVGTLWAAGIRWPGGSAMAGESISYDLQGASRAAVSIFPGIASLSIEPLSTGDVLISGNIPSSSPNRKVQQEFTKEGDLAKIILQSTGFPVILPASQQNLSNWDLAITQTVPVNLQIEMAMGDSSLKLNGMDLINLDHQIALGQVKIALPETSNFSGRISGAIGQIVLSTPENIGLQVEMGTALVARTLPADYVKIGENLYRSPNYDDAEYRVNLRVDLAIGHVVIEEK